MKKLTLFGVILIAVVSASAQERPIVKKEYQSPREYIQALEDSLNLYEKNELTSLEFENIFFPSGNMQFFLSYNYDQPEVAQLLRRIEDARISESVANNVSDYITGKQRQRDIYLRKSHPEIAKPVPLLTGGYAPEDPEPSITPDPMSAPIWLNEQKVAGNPATPAVGPVASPRPSSVLSPPQSPNAEVVESPPVPKSNATESIPETDTFPIIPVAVIAALLIAGVVFLLRRKKP